MRGMPAVKIIIISRDTSDGDSAFGVTGDLVSRLGLWMSIGNATRHMSSEQVSVK